MYYLINGSPGKNGNAAQMMKKAAEGIKGAGGEGVITHLYDYQFKGCVSCFRCKLKLKEPDHCPVNDGIVGLLEDINHADGIVLGSTLYYSDVSGALRSFLERLYFSHMFYNKENRPAPLSIPCAVIIACVIPSFGIVALKKKLRKVGKQLGHLCGTKPEYLSGMGTILFQKSFRYEAEVNYKTWIE